MADQLFTFLLEHQLSAGTVATLLAAFTHSKLGSRPLTQKLLGLALPAFLNGPLMKALAVDVAKAVLAAWDAPKDPAP